MIDPMAAVQWPASIGPHLSLARVASKVGLNRSASAVMNIKAIAFAGFTCFKVQFMFGDLRQS